MDTTEIQRITTSNYMPIKWTTQKKWTHSQKGIIFQRPNLEETENKNRPVTSTEIESVKKFYLFTFGCAGSSLLCGLSSSYSE